MLLMIFYMMGNIGHFPLPLFLKEDPAVIKQYSETYLWYTVLFWSISFFLAYSAGELLKLPEKESTIHDNVVDKTKRYTAFSFTPAIIIGYYLRTLNTHQESSFRIIPITEMSIEIIFVITGLILGYKWAQTELRQEAK